VQAENIDDDIVFEMELVKQIEVNIDYIIMLIEKYHKSNCKDKEILISIDRAIKASIELRSKKELIEKNLKHYIDECEKAGYLPKFRDYVMNNGAVLSSVLSYAKELGYASKDATVEDISFNYKGYTIPYGYYKFLGDFSMFTPDGKASAQKVLSLENYDFDKAVDFFSDAESLRRNEILQQFANGEERAKYRDSKLSAEELKNKLKVKDGGEKYLFGTTDCNNNAILIICSKI
jgi:hypothetical protein